MKPKIKKNKKLRNLLLGSLISTTIGLGSAIYFTYKPSNEEAKRMESYISEINNFGHNRKKPTLYIILQRHSLENQGYDIEREKRSVTESLESQLSIYRIIRGLHKGKGLELICGEGHIKNDLADVEQPLTWHGRSEKEVNDLIKYLDLDNYLFHALSKGGLSASDLVALDKKIYVVGFEEQAFVNYMEKRAKLNLEMNKLQDELKKYAEELDKLSNNQTLSEQEMKDSIIKMQDKLKMVDKFKKNLEEEIKYVNYWGFKPPAS